MTLDTTREHIATDTIYCLTTRFYSKTDEKSSTFTKSCRKLSLSRLSGTAAGISHILLNSEDDSEYDITPIFSKEANENKLVHVKMRGQSHNLNPGLSGSKHQIPFFLL